MQGHARASFEMLSSMLGREKLDDYSARYASHDLVASISFAGMEVKPTEVFSLAFFMAAAALAMVVITGAAAFVLELMDNAMAVMLVLCGGILPLLVYVYVGEYPEAQGCIHESPFAGRRPGSDQLHRHVHEAEPQHRARL